MLEPSFQKTTEGGILVQVLVLTVGQRTISDQISWMCNLSCTWAVTMSGQMLDQVVANLQPISCDRH